MFNSFPRPVPDGKAGIPSPLDWSAYTAVYDWTGTLISVAALTYQTFVNITGEGFLLFARGDSSIPAARNPDMRITVDGVAYIFEGVDAGAGSQGNVIGNPIYYKSSLKIEAINRSGSASNMRCDYTYLSKAGNPSKLQTLLNSTSRKMAYGTNATASDTDVVNIAGSGYLLAVEFSGFYTSSAQSIVGTVTVDSVIKMTGRTLFYLGGEQNKQHLFLGPIRFTSNLRVQHSVSVLGLTAVTKVWYILD